VPTATRPASPSELTDALIVEQIDEGSRVIDLGCGDGRLLAKLREQKRCSVLGVELKVDRVLGSIDRGVPVIQGDLDVGLPVVPDGAFDYAVLSETLQQVRLPKVVLGEMLRVARRAVVLVPNFGHWRVRWQILKNGRAPVTRNLPYEWYETPNLHFMSMRDFAALCERLGIRITKEIPIVDHLPLERAWWANWRAHSALYVVERG
jgi:methionine biosynthesis protein MetW